MRMLADAWSLADVHDVEAFAQATLSDYQHSHGASWLSPDDKEDCIASLLEASYSIWLRWDSALTGRFSQYLRYRLYEHAIPNWYRSHPRFGRSEGKRLLNHVASEDERHEDTTAGDEVVSEALFTLATEKLSRASRRTLKMVRLMAGLKLTAEQAAERYGLPVGEFNQLRDQLRAELVDLGVAT